MKKVIFILCFALSWGMAQEAGLLDFNARYYDPGMGRFIQPDTIIPDPANPQTLNRYSYVNNNPINFNDPTGHEGEEADRQEAAEGPPEGMTFEEWVIADPLAAYEYDPERTASELAPRVVMEYGVANYIGTPEFLNFHAEDLTYDQWMMLYMAGIDAFAEEYLTRPEVDPKEVDYGKFADATLAIKTKNDKRPFTYLPIIVKPQPFCILGFCF